MCTVGRDLALAAQRLLLAGWRALSLRQDQADYWRATAERMTEMVKARQRENEELLLQMRLEGQSYFAFAMWDDRGLGPQLLEGLRD